MESPPQISAWKKLLYLLWSGYDLFFHREKMFLDNKTNNPWNINKNWEKEVVVLGDQGFGDQIQFISYLPFL